MTAFQNSPKIIVSPNKDIHIPKVSMGKYIMKCLEEGQQETAYVDAHTGKMLTYKQLLNYSIKLAQILKEDGLDKKDVIAIISPNNINYVIPVFASLYIGAISHMVNAKSTLYELSKLFNISKPKYIFCSDENLEIVLELKKQKKFIKTIITFGDKTGQAMSFEELLQSRASFDRFELEDVDIEDVAYIFNSSGTTGLPKCVLLTHQNAVSAAVLAKVEDYFAFKKGESLLLPLPVSHIYGFCCFVHSALALNKCVIMETFIPDSYLQSIEKYKITKITGPPTLMKFLAESSLVDHYDLSSITDITYASAPLQDDTRKMVQKRLNALTRQAYGATETVAGTISMPKNIKKPGSCGIVLPTLTAKICDSETLELLGPNQPGELYIKGSVVMKGYLENPEATIKSFDKDGFFRTGDLAYYDEDGFVFIVDRLKEVIKYKGYQVSPSELESIIMLHSAVLDVSVIGIPDERAGELPMAYVVLKDGFNDVSEKTIVEYVAEHVNSTKWLYGGVKFVQQLPKTSSGKTKREELRNMAKDTRIIQSKQ